MSADVMRRPGAVTAGAVLLPVSGLLSVFLVGNDPGMGLLPTALWAAGLWFSVRAGRGRRIARTTASVLTGLSALLAAPYGWHMAGTPSLPWPANALVHLVAVAVGAAGVALLHRPESHAYVDARSPRRDRTPEG